MKQVIITFVARRTAALIICLTVMTLLIGSVVAVSFSSAGQRWFGRATGEKQSLAVSSPNVGKRSGPVRRATEAPTASLFPGNSLANFDSFKLPELMSSSSPFLFAPCPNPTLSYDLAGFPPPARLVNVGDQLIVDPTSGPVNASNIALFSSGSYSGGIGVNNISGRVSIVNAAPAGADTTITVQATNTNNPSGCTGTGSTFASFELKVNGPPTVAINNFTRTAGGNNPPESNPVIIATVSDDFTPKQNLIFRVDGGTSATVNGVTVNNLTGPNILTGNVTANVTAACGATTATFTVSVTDGNGLTSNNAFTVTVNPDPAPTPAAYNSTPYNVNQGASLTINPVTAPSDNNTITSVTAGPLGGYNGMISVTTAGVVSLTNASPGGTTPEVTLQFTDNCGVVSTSSFKVKINGPPSVSTSPITLNQGRSITGLTIGTATDVEDAETALTVKINGMTSATNDNVTVSNLMIDGNGNITADITIGCTATIGPHTFTLTATDTQGLQGPSPAAPDNLTISVTANPPPTLSYPFSVSIGAGTASTTISPVTGPSDNGSVTGLSGTGLGATSCGTISLNTTPGADFGKVTVANAPNTQATCTVGVTATDNCGATTTASFTIKTTAPNVGVSKTHSQISVQPGESAIFKLNFTNSGDQDATGATLTDVVPANTTFDAVASSPGWSCPDGSPAATSCTYTIGNIGIGGAGSVFFAVKVVNPVSAAVTQISNSFSYADSITGSKTSNTDTIAINAAPDVSVTKTDNGITSGPGQTIVYFVSYSNVGRKEALGVVLTETVPTNTTFNAAASAPSIWTCANGSGAGTSCTITIGNLGGGASGTHKFAVNVVSPLPAGTTQVQNTASISLTNGPDPVLGNNTTTDTTPVGNGPTLMPLLVTRTQGAPATNSNIAIVTDDLAAATSIVVAPTSLPAGISVTNITNISGTIKANVRADCTAALGANTVGLKGTDSAGNMVTANLTVTVVAPVVTLGLYPPAGTINLGASTTVTPSAGPTDTGVLATVVATASPATFTGALSVNPTTGIVTISNAGPPGNYTITVKATDSCGVQMATQTFPLTVNGPPTITPAAGLTVQQGTSAAGATIATVNDDLTPVSSLTVVKLSSPIGISVTGITNSVGTIMANLAADCTATIGANTVVLQVTDGGGLTATGNLVINVTANTAPTLGTYTNQTLSAGTGATVTPSAAPMDNGSIMSLTANAPGFTGTLSTNPATGVVTIANAGPLGAFTVTVTAKDNCGASTSATFTITVTCPTVTVTPPGVTTGTVGTFFSQNFTQSGGLGNIAFTLNSGALPAGITLATNGTLSGTPSQSGSFPITVKATDVNGCMGVSATYTLVINCQTITVTNPGTTTGTVGMPFSVSFTQAGAIGSVNFTVNSGTIPAGLTLNLNGTLSGTPTQQGTFPLTIRATDSNGCSGVGATYNLIINCPTITIAPATLPSGVYGDAYNTTISATPAGTYAFTVTVGALPTGLSLNPMTGALTGTPLAVGSFTFTVTANYYGSCLQTKVYTLVINCPTITFTPPNLQTGTIGVAYTQTVTANPLGNYLYSVAPNTLPPGLTINANTGVISGTPTLIGTYNFTVTATGQGALATCSGSKQYTIIINCRVVTVTPPTTLPGGKVGDPYSQTISASPANTYTFMVSAGALPPGLSLNTNTGVLSGTPTTPGTFSFTIKATDPDTCSGSQAYTVVISCPTIVLSPVILPTGTIGTTYPTTTLSAAPAGNYSFLVTSGNLPAGLTLTNAGVLSGTPTQGGNFPITVTATDANQCAGSRSYTLVINLCPPITVDPLTISDAATNTPYSQTFTATGSGPSYTFTETGSLPNGLSLSFSGVLSGTPTQSGSFPITVFATDANNCTGSRSYTLKVNLGCSFTITTTTLPNGTVGAVYNQTLSANGTAPYNFSIISGALPAGISLSTGGTFTGAPTVGGTFNFTVQGIDKNNCVATKPFTLTIGAKKADFDADAKTDYAVWRPSDGVWYVIRSANNQVATQQWGINGDIPVPGDYDGDGKTDYAVFRPSTRVWWILPSSTGQYRTQQWGLNGDIPVPGDYDGDGKTDYAVWRPSDGTWWVLPSSTGQYRAQGWGLTGDVPVPGDYDGDGKTDYAVWRPSNGTWWVLPSSTGQYRTQQWGLNGDVPVAGDYDGDGKTDYAVWRPSNGTWWVLPSSTGQYRAQGWGLNGDIPVPGDYDNDGKTDYAVWRPSNGTWWVLPSSTGQYRLQQWGLTGDLPVPAYGAP